MLEMQSFNEFKPVFNKIIPDVDEMQKNGASQGEK